MATNIEAKNGEIVVNGQVVSSPHTLVIEGQTYILTLNGNNVEVTQP